MVKRILIITITVLIALSGFLTGFFSVGCMSVYASVNDDSVYVPLRSENDAVKVFQAYCKSRDLTIEGSLTDAVTTFTTGAFNSACNEIGIDITELQAEIKAEYDSSGEPVKFLLNDTGVMAMNRIFAQFLQDNELQVGDTNINKEVYNGEVFIDSDGNSALVYISPVINSWDNSIVEGTPWKYTTDDIFANASANGSFPISMNYVNNNYTITAYYYEIFDQSNHRLVNVGNNTSQNQFYRRRYKVGSDVLNPTSQAGRYNNGNVAIIKYNSQYYYGIYYENLDYDSTNGFSLYRKYVTSMTLITAGTAESSNVVIISTQINNNIIEGDTIINNDGDIITDPEPVEPNNPNDTIHNVPENPLSPNDDGGWDIDLPDIDIPNLPLGNLSEKFPFSIPWDLVAFYAMLDADPEAPRFNGTMDLTLVQWNYDIDLSPFDSAAELCRKLQFGLFVVGLIVASRSIIRG